MLPWVQAWTAMSTASSAEQPGNFSRIFAAKRATCSGSGLPMKSAHSASRNPPEVASQTGPSRTGETFSEWTSLERLPLVSPSSPLHLVCDSLLLGSVSLEGVTRALLLFGLSLLRLSDFLALSARFELDLALRSLQLLLRPD